MDPHLIDLVWEVYREVGATEPIHVVCGYRSPGHQRHAAPALAAASPSSASTCSARRSTSTSPASRSSNSRGRPAPPARRRRLLSVVGRALRPPGYRQRAPLAAGAGSSAGACHGQGTADPRGVQQRPDAGGAEAAEVPAGGRRLAQCSRRGGRCGGYLPGRTAWPRDRIVGPAAAGGASTVAAAVPMPKSRPGAAPEPAQSGFNLASASSQPVRAPSQQTQEPEAAPSGFNLASVNARIVPAAPRPTQAASLVPQATISANDVINERGYWQGLTDERPVPPADIPEARTAAAPEAPITGSVARSSLAPWPMPDRQATRTPWPMRRPAKRPTAARRRPASSPSSRTPPHDGAAPKQAARPAAAASRSASVSTIRGCAR